MISTPISSITFNYTISNDFLQPHLVSLTTLSRLLYMVKQTAKTNSSSVMCANCLMICHTDDRMVEKYTTIYTMINDDDNDENLRLFGKYAKVYVTKLSVILPNK